MFNHKFVIINSHNRTGLRPHARARILNHRTQHPVGMGFFHSGQLSLVDYDAPESFMCPSVGRSATPFNYVYDCGTQSEYIPRCGQEIAYHHNGLDGRAIDMLFISHIHEDHINGIPKLLKDKKVKTIVLPYLDEIDLLLAAGSAGFYSGRKNKGFLGRFVEDPLGTLGEFNPDRIILVRGKSEKPDLHFAYDEAGPPSELCLDTEKLERHAETPEGIWSPGSKQDKLFLIEQGTPLMLRSSTGRIPWLFLTYVDSQESGKRRFVTAAASNFGMSESVFLDWISDGENRRAAVFAANRKLRDAYEQVNADLNLTSLSLYSGPCLGISSLSRITNLPCPSSALGGWLGTGDSDLKNKGRRKSFLNFYGELLKQVSTLTFPHHGSAKNFHRELLERCPAELCIAAADKHGSWTHPGKRVVQAALDLGRFPFTTSALESTRVCECVIVQ